MIRVQMLFRKTCFMYMNLVLCNHQGWPRHTHLSNKTTVLEPNVVCRAGNHLKLYTWKLFHDLQNCSWFLTIFFRQYPQKILEHLIPLNASEALEKNGHLAFWKFEGPGPGFSTNPLCVFKFGLVKERIEM